MARYVQLGLGVHDRSTGLDVTPYDAEWEMYHAWIVAGNLPDPVVVPVVAVSVPELLAQVNRLCETKIDAGIMYDGHPYQTNQASRDVIVSYVATIAAGIALPSGFTFRDTNNANVAFNDAAMKGLLAAINTRTSNLRAHSGMVKSNIENAENPSLISLTEGWPE